MALLATRFASQISIAAFFIVVFLFGFVPNIIWILICTNFSWVTRSNPHPIVYMNQMMSIQGDSTSWRFVGCHYTGAIPISLYFILLSIWWKKGLPICSVKQEINHNIRDLWCSFISYSKVLWINQHVDFEED